MCRPGSRKPNYVFQVYGILGTEPRRPASVAVVAGISRRRESTTHLQLALSIPVDAQKRLGYLEPLEKAGLLLLGNRDLCARISRQAVRSAEQTDRHPTAGNHGQAPQRGRWGLRSR